MSASATQGGHNKWLENNRSVSSVVHQLYVNMLIGLCLIAALAQLYLAPYESLPITSTCASIDVPEGANPGTTVEFRGTATNGSINALAVDINDVLSIVEMAREQLDVAISYSGYATISTHNIAAIDWSDADDCALLSETILYIQNSIIDANFSVASLATTRDNIVMTVNVFGETDATINIDFGNGLLSVPVCEVNASLSVLTYNYTYEKPGTYEVIVSSYNYVSNITKSQIIDVYEIIDDVDIFGNSTILVPPGFGTWRILAGENEAALENIVCVWNMGTNYADTTYIVAMLNSSMPHEIEFTYAQADVGTQTISVNCSNPVSSQNLTMDVNLVWDNVTLGELNCTSSILWNHSLTCQLTIIRFGTGACFEWDMGDGKKVVYYQDGYCAADIYATSPTYVQVISQFR